MFTRDPLFAVSSTSGFFAMLTAVLSCQCHGPSWAGVSCVTPTTRNWPCACSRLEMSWMAIHNSKGILNQGLRKGLSSLLKLTPGVCTILRASLVFPFSMLNDTALQPSHDVFMRVAREIFSDGKFNWGRVVALFYFACRLVIKVRVESGSILFSSPFSLNHSRALLSSVRQRKQGSSQSE